MSTALLPEHRAEHTPAPWEIEDDGVSSGKLIRIIHVEHDADEYGAHVAHVTHIADIGEWPAWMGEAK